MPKRLLFALIGALCLQTPQKLKAYLISNTSGYDIEVHLDFGKGGIGNLGTIANHNFTSSTTLESNGYRLKRILILANTSGTLEEQNTAYLPVRTDEQLKSDKITVEVGFRFKYIIIDKTLAEAATESKAVHAASTEAAQAEQLEAELKQVEVKAEETKTQSEAVRVQVEREKEKELIIAVTALKIKAENKS